VLAEGDKMKTYIIAEMAQSYEGDLNLCKKLIVAAKKCGAHAVKFQIFKPNELCTKDYQYFELFSSLEMPEAKWKEAIDFARAQGVDFLVDIFGVETLEWISKYPIQGVKIHSTDLKNTALLRALENKGRKIYLSTGGSSLEELEKALQLLGKNDIVLMSGFQAEPNQLGDVELDKLEFLKAKFKLPVGYADHLDANDALAVYLPAMAVLKGASVVEKHLTLERNTLQLEDSMSALNPSEFITMMSMIEKVEQFRHTGTQYSLTEREEAYRVRSKKAVLSRVNIAAGEKIRGEDLQLLRTGQKVPKILDIEKIVGHKAKKNIPAETVITEELYE
jgi:N,N'-diacetyllegionaminate synthase